MLQVFKSLKWFTILYFFVVVIDVFVKLCLPLTSYRYATKVLLIVLVILFYHNNKDHNRKKRLFVYTALSFFFMGDILVLNHSNTVVLAVCLLIFFLAKLFLSFRFSHKHDFKITRLIPFLIVMFLYIIAVFNLIYTRLHEFLLPAILTFFISLLLLQFAVLRKGVVNKSSYLCVLFGVLFYILTESMMAIKIFSEPFIYQEALIIIFYTFSVYLIHVGIVREKIIKRDY